ncbi:alkylhydroperoxidase AhpD family core domain-containing protein [Cohnella sp. OV330]|uniref:carboxymuconolactone decarboxylase family protein n=1 Tax=Cohnella sp. OV330 TaxID=1855288 RepID=UPI0008E7F232|nr:carboxymuconolactone decarboxylase family protein [Cohnella sp. OV330]SFB49879.1 alkylhydroperoxidase AhpD family core domain-containing protein [Cohnella sp. OV330]
MTVSAEQDSLYARSNFPKYAPKFVPHAPEAFKAFGEFNKAAMQEGALGAKLKEIIAIASAHATGCPYCIDLHVAAGRKLQATKEEVVEAIGVSALVKGGSALYHGINALNAYEESPADDLYARENLTKLEALEAVNEELYTAFVSFGREVLTPRSLGAKDKALVAVAIAHIEGCAYSIEYYTKLAKSEGASLAELAETIVVAGALKAGSAMAHRVNAYIAYERAGE